MSKSVPEKRKHIRPEMTVLDVVSKYRQTEAVFKQYDQQAGECICCQALFESLQGVAARYKLDLEELLTDLETAVNML
ncbi:MAG: hypothetical protein JRJ86_00965 [Deltaproteobacteria bacterium]|nr:hypothetical protein [Deltaproteobacteria bacterium]MBW2116564.1 hypothetical protein [Deltaproteobacteria bacterium]MBW2344123.1 hypothetical protein [Deltaproteobacteria bacterium]